MSWLRTIWIGLALGVLGVAGCERDTGLLLPARESGDTISDEFVLVARLAHVTDMHVVDTLSPARFAQAHELTYFAWRPFEAYSTQLADGIIRTANRIHASGRIIDFLVHTGDVCDNVQRNELSWFLSLMDGETVDPLSGPDDRPADARPEPGLDPYAAFEAQGLYQQGRHGDLPSIPWYTVLGNHEVYAVGVFPIFTGPDGQRTAPLPADRRPGWWLPVRLDPVAAVAYGNVTPADPGPPDFFSSPGPVQPSPARAYFSRAEFIQALFGTATQPPGHGFLDPQDARGWTSVSPVAGLRLVRLDTNDRPTPMPGDFCSEGALSRAQLAFLRTELEAATARGELVVVMSHASTETIQPALGSEVTPDELREMLNQYPNVVLHLTGHTHRNWVVDRGGYIEIETCSTLDLPQEGRLIEIWRDPADGRVLVRYEMFSHLDATLPPLGDDPLRPLREQAQAIALAEKAARETQKRYDPSGVEPAGAPALPGRDGVVWLKRRRASCGD